MWKVQIEYAFLLPAKKNATNRDNYKKPKSVIV